MSVIFEKSIKGRKGITLPKNDVPVDVSIPQKYKREDEPPLCELSELDVVRHFTALSTKNYGVDTGLYPLGSCTMKYNPKFCEKIAAMEGFSNLHPLLPQLKRGGMLTQGALAVLHELEAQLCEITAMDAFTLHPLAGAHGELTGMMLIAAYHKNKGNSKNEVLIPDEAHGTNPSSAAIAGYKVRSIPTDPETGTLDIKALQSIISHNTAAIMLTNPNTLGLFNSDVKKIAQIAHSFDALLYYDGANLNAIMGKFRPGDADFDVVHLNLHKTFATPHGGGGPGSGPVGVKKHLEPFLPISRIAKRSDGSYALDYDHPKSIGYIAPFYGNFEVCLKAYAYILLLGKNGLSQVSETAVLNANYIMHSLKDHYHIPFLKTCMHECVLSAKKQMEHGVRAVDIAKGLIDRGFHPPTVYFPLIVKEALMIEPTETESKEMIDSFIEAMISISKEAQENPETLKEAPVSTPVGRLDETKAAKEMDIAYLSD
ncbi:aminomethyl-transferring glycine dehydrogenase subunit GcvPB [Chitinispirillales bacterium ANBcel5]|uniref:aminomethyl-transferring glycine dehydrogenase subunit GcvPB n=1 Tax=Cellulosispirillum alkaliphilum TaxID=3039283 RepID=UPI002A4F8272|nr:aminomethyl-transferring glycine dehydrogenase subunit GcvPB [Chitinispirillales bacterium ANBcel5]